MSPFGRTLLVVHIVFGTAAVIAGFVALVVPKLSATGGRRHRKAGRVFIFSMIAVLASATVLTVLSLNPYFAGLTAASTVAVFSGRRVLGRKRPDLDPRQRATTLDWVVTLVLAGVAIMLLVLVHAGRVTANLPVVLSLGVGTLLYASYDLYRFARPLAFPFTPTLWLHEHLVKMLGGYFGAVAAFSGSVLLFLDPPWRQLWATMTGQTLAIVLVLYYRRVLRRRASSPGVRGVLETASTA